MSFWVGIWIRRGFSENLNTDCRIYGFMVKAKITVSVDKGVVDTAKIALLKRGRTLSDFIEKSLRSLSTAQILDDLCRELKLECEYMSNEEVESKRPDLRGKVASEVEVREIRRERLSRVL
jgi:hypothetical protein